MPGSAGAISASVAAPSAPGVVFQEVQNAARPATCCQAMPRFGCEEFHRLSHKDRKCRIERVSTPSHLLREFCRPEPQLRRNWARRSQLVRKAHGNVHRRFRVHPNALVGRNECSETTERVTLLARRRKRVGRDERFGYGDLDGAKPHGEIDRSREVVVDLETISPHGVDEPQRPGLVWEHPVLGDDFLRVHSSNASGGMNHQKDLLRFSWLEHI